MRKVMEHNAMMRDYERRTDELVQEVGKLMNVLDKLQTIDEIDPKIYNRFLDNFTAREEKIRAFKEELRQNIPDQYHHLLNEGE